MQTGPTIELSNNIIINLGTSLGTGRNVAYRRSTATHATYHPNSNNNLFFAGTPSANNLIFSDNTNNLQTIAAYRNYFQLFLPVRDAESVSENVTFLSLVNSSADFLRVNPATPNQIESGGRIIPNILSDFNNPTARVSFPLVGQINGGGNFPDIGAYEQDMQISDIEGPSITFNALRNGSTFATNRILANVNIRDKSGIDTSALFGPKVYYRKNANANTLASTNNNLTDGWKFATPLNSSSPYNFSIDYNNLFGGPPTINDTIYYFVIAQDRQVVPNVNASIGTVFGAPLTSSSLSFSNFPISGSSFYVIDTALMPTYTVGATGADFTSFTRTDGFFNFVNNGVLTGPVTVNVIADITNENGAISLNPLSIDATNPDTAIITIKSTSGTRIVSGSITTGGLFKFNNTSNVVIDGSDIMGTPNNLIFNNTATSGANAVFAFIGTNNSEGCRNITLANSIIYNGNRINTSSTVIFIGGATVTSSNTTGGYFNNKIRIINNTIYRAYSGIQVIHHPLSFADSITILDNIIGSDTANNTFSGAGLRLNGMTNSLIKSNNIFNVTNNTTLSTSLYGLWITGNFFNSAIDANHIDRISYTGTQYNQTRGMSITASINANVTISNNQIKRIFSSGADFNVFYGPAGIYFDGTGNNYNIVNNTIHLTGDRPLNTFVYYSYTYNLANAYSAALALNTSALTGVNLHNNILSNTQTASNAASPGFNFALFASNSAIFSNISHNVYWASSTNAGMTNGFFVGGTQTTFAAYRTAMPTDRYSQFIRVPFINDTTLLINTTDSAAWNLFGRAMPLSYLANDFYDSSISTSIASGPNCIGAIKFSEPISVAPVAIASAIPAPNTTTFYFNGGDTIAAITWGSSSFVPVDFRLRYYPGKMPANPHASARYLAAQWDLEGIPVTGFDYSLRLYYNPIHLFNISNQSSLIGANYFGMVWTPAVFGSTVDSIRRTIQTNNLSNLGIYTGTDVLNPLPVKLAKFDVTKNQNNALVSWQTASEKNALKFEVEFSYDKKSFNTAGFVSAKGNSNTIVKYQFNHKHAVKEAIANGSSVIYYRLKQVDKDGSYDYSEVRALQIITIVDDEFAIWPNPFNTDFTLESLQSQDNVEIKIVDLTGKTVFNKHYNYLENSTEINLSHLPAGIYILNIERNKESKSFKLLKQ